MYTVDIVSRPHLSSSIAETDRDLDYVNDRHICCFTFPIHWLELSQDIIKSSQYCKIAMGDELRGGMVMAMDVGVRARVEAFEAFHRPQHPATITQ